jgi:Zn-finger nucleic acid-binding protein
MDAKTLNCPSCGAAVAADSVQCQYCGSRLQTIACPSCFGMVFLGSRFCQHCGAAVAAASEEQQTKCRCPRCNVNLEKISLANTPLDECPQCGGLWIKCAVFERICADREAQSAAIGLQLPSHAPPEESVRYIHCPQCDELMNRMNYAHCSGIVINICRPHGVWLDRDEIRQIVEFIRAGGLEKERQKEKEELADERRQLDAQRQAQAAEESRYSAFACSRHHSGDAVDVIEGLASLAGWLLK